MQHMNLQHGLPANFNGNINFVDGEVTATKKFITKFFWSKGFWKE